jgi:hypothetical protein
LQHIFSENRRSAEKALYFGVWPEAGIAAARQPRDEAKRQIAACPDLAAEKRIATRARKVAADICSRPSLADDLRSGPGAGSGPSHSCRPALRKLWRGRPVFSPGFSRYGHAPRRLRNSYETAFKIFLNEAGLDQPDDLDHPMVGLFQLICDMGINPGAAFPLPSNTVLDHNEFMGGILCRTISFLRPGLQNEYWDGLFS